MEVQSVAESPDPTEICSEPMQLNFTRNDMMQEHWNAANEHLRAVFTDNPFNLACDVCDRLWFAKDFKKVKVRHMRLLETTFPGEEVAAFHLCGTCCKALDANEVPTLSRSNGCKYAPKLVYVALNHVTSLDGLYLTNTRDDHKFYHCYGSTAPAVKEIKDEYVHMNKHGLPAFAKQASHFCRPVSSSEVTEIAPDPEFTFARPRT
jgi:hypothetical protein